MLKWISRRPPARDVAAGLEAGVVSLPDALVIATAIERSAAELLTTDRKWPTARSLKLNTTITQI